MSQRIPESVMTAVVAMWLSVAISIFICLFKWLSGAIGLQTFVFALLFASAFGVFPYMVAKRSNSARLVYIFLEALVLLVTIKSFFFGWAGSIFVWLIDVIDALLGTYSIYLLLQRESSGWFRGFED